jgi:hypothetical protein
MKVICHACQEELTVRGGTIYGPPFAASGTEIACVEQNLCDRCYMRVQEFLAELRSQQKRWTTERDPDLAADLVLIGMKKTTKSHVRKELQAEGFVVDVAIFEPGKTLPESLRTPGGALIVGLKKDAGLIQLVRQQSTFLGDPVADGYFDRNVIQSGLDALETLCARRNWPVVDVSRRSFRETAAEIIDLYKQRERSKKKEASSA